MDDAPPAYDNHYYKVSRDNVMYVQVADEDWGMDVDHCITAVHRVLDAFLKKKS